MGIVVRNLGPEEVAGASVVMDGVMQRAFNAPPFGAQLGWYAAIQPDGFVIAEDIGDGQRTMVGTGCGIAYPGAGFGWIGVIATEPSHQRRGIGEKVTDCVADVLARHGCASVLDASLAGGPLYERMGFVDFGPTRVMAVDVETARAGTSGSRSRVEPITAANIDEVAAFDAAVFGADRALLLRLLVEDYPGRGALVRAADRHVAGFVIAQHAVIGPFAADDNEVLAHLLAFAAGLPWSTRPQVCVPPDSIHVPGLVELGCRTARELRHMRRGIDMSAGRSDRYAGRISLGIG